MTEDPGQFLALFDDFHLKPGFPQKRLLVAHYTTLEVLEKILGTNEIWFSNPLFMNDLEGRFGILRGYEMVMSSDDIEEACQSSHWPEPGSEDTELGVLMELEVDHGTTEVYAGVQA